MPLLTSLKLNLGSLAPPRIHIHVAAITRALSMLASIAKKATNNIVDVGMSEARIT